MAVFAIPLILLLAAGLLFGLGKYTQQRSLRLYTSLGDRLGFETVVPPTRLAGFVRPEPYLTGEIDGREATVSAGERGPGGIRQVETVVKLQTPTRQFRMQVVRRGSALGKIAGIRKDGLKKFTTGIAAFDEVFELRGNQPETLRRFIGDPEVRASLTHLLTESTDLFLIGGDTFVFAKHKVMTTEADVDRIETALQTLAQLARAFTRARSTPTPLNPGTPEA